MKKRNLIITALAGVMIIGGSIGVYANTNDKQIKPMKKMTIAYSLSEEDKAELEKMKGMTPEELLEYIKEHKPKVVPKIKAMPAKQIHKMSEEDKAQLEKMKDMSPEELQEYIKEHNPKMVPAMKVQKAHFVKTIKR